MKPCIELINCKICVISQRCSGFMGSGLRTLVLLNPISGGYSKAGLRQSIENELCKKTFDFQIVETQSTEHLTRLAGEAVNQHIDLLVAVGGDGTVSRAAALVAGSGTTLGIIPAGSGNGYARSLGIPMNYSKAIAVLNQYQATMVDTGLLNGKTFVNVAGIGFDAHVAAMFQHSQKRGLINYARISIGEYFKYKPFACQINQQGAMSTEQAMIISICIGSQFGNNAYIAPLADMRDGKFDITIIRDAGLLHVPGIIWRLFSKRLKPSDQIKMFAADKFQIIRTGPAVVHLDGDAYHEQAILNFQVKPLSLRVLTCR